MITVLRLGHRRGRDDRISTHVGLTARQFGADRIVYSGKKDSNMMESLRDVCDRWGGDFEVEYREDFRRVIKDFEGLKVHLTMYGEPFQEQVSEIRQDMEDKEVLVIVGSQKVPREVYGYADYNIAVGNQPHSEVTATGIFLYELNGRKVPEVFEDAEVKVIPSEDQKLTETFDG